VLSIIRAALAFVALAGFAIPAGAQQAADQITPDPVVQLFLAKGYLTQEEAASIQRAPTRPEADNRMLKIFLSKGLISQAEFDAASVGAPQPAVARVASDAHMLSAAVTGAALPGGSAAAAVTPPVPPSDPEGQGGEPKVIPAVAPPRPLPIGIPRDPKGIIPDIKLGSGAMMNIYGFLKATAIYDTTNSGGAVNGSNDFPLPLLLNTGGLDTGPDRGSQFRIKARSTRIGANFFWPINGPNLTLTGKLEVDFEGDYTVVNNRNVSSARSSQPSIRHAWMRMDAKLGEVPWFLELGQDWTLLGTSIVPDYIETTQNGNFYGSLNERLPQIKTGLQFSAGSLKIQPEFAITWSNFGDGNLNNTTTTPILGSLGAVPTGQQTQGRAGSVVGAASGQPGVQGRIVFDFPLNKSWKGVPNTEIIVSGGHAEAEEIVPIGNIPTTAIAGLTVATGATPNGLSATACTGAPAAGFSIRCYYPTGATNRIPQNIGAVGFQLPTPWFTLSANYFRGGDLRFFFAGILNSAFIDTQGGTPITIPGPTTLVTTTGTANIAQNVFSLSGDPITFLNRSGSAVLAPYRPIRGQGGFVQFGIPLSRIFGANPDGWNAGWRLFFAYGTDSVFARDVIRPGGNNLNRTDYVPVSLRYKVNRWVEIVNETTWYDTRTADSRTALFRGIPAHVNHDIRNEFGTIFTF